MACFVTVGTTLFEDLINQVLSEKCVENLKKVGVKSIKLQIGKGNFEKSTLDRVFGELADKSDQGKANYQGINVEFYRFKPSISGDMSEAFIIIGHAGAGTCLEALALQKPFITVTNDKLMDNHQTELADKLSDDGHLLQCTPMTLADSILNENLFKLRPFKPAAKNLVAEHIRELVGVQKLQ
uniref:UDP-N-acetylglucosamine transferase subunit ALG13 n=1 Tax=Caenorhabditis japonica TaxID=281687 RepID=A0A8R1DJR4_CAEJA